MHGATVKITFRYLGCINIAVTNIYPTKGSLWNTELSGGSERPYKINVRSMASSFIPVCAKYWKKVTVFRRLLFRPTRHCRAPRQGTWRDLFQEGWSHVLLPFLQKLHESYSSLMLHLLWVPIALFGLKLYPHRLIYFSWSAVLGPAVIFLQYHAITIKQKKLPCTKHQDVKSPSFNVEK